MRQFSTEHLAALGVMAAAAALSIATARRGSERAVRLLSRSLALVILAGWIGEQIADVVEGIWSVKYTLPLQLTDVVSVVAVVALLRPRPLPVELTWFWALTATLQATLTPDLSRTFPSAFYFTYFAYHVGAIVAACLLVIGERRYPRPGAAWRVFAVTARMGGGGRRGRPGHGRQLHVPAREARALLAAERHGALALVHPRDRRRGSWPCCSRCRRSPRSCDVAISAQ